MPTKAERPIVSKFATEAQEAEWWDQHQQMIEEELIKAIKDGSTLPGPSVRLGKEKASRPVTIRLPAKDIERARRLAGSKGIGYQVYIRMLLQEALDRETRKAG